MTMSIRHRFQSELGTRGELAFSNSQRSAHSKTHNRRSNRCPSSGDPMNGAPGGVEQPSRRGGKACGAHGETHAAATRPAACLCWSRFFIPNPPSDCGGPKRGQPRRSVSGHAQVARLDWPHDAAPVRLDVQSVLARMDKRECWLTEEPYALTGARTDLCWAC